MTMTGKYRTAYGDTCPSATLSTTNLMWTDLGSNSGLCCERSMTPPGSWKDPCIAQLKSVYDLQYHFPCMTLNCNTSVL